MTSTVEGASSIRDENLPRPTSPSSSTDGLDMFSEPENFRPSTPPPQVLRVPYDFSGSSSTMTLESASDVQSASIHASAYAEDDDLRIHLLGAHPLWGHHLWNASLDISRYLQRHASSLLHGGKSVLELGAAAGVPSIVCAREGAECVVATDYPDQPLIDVLIKNLETNMHTKSGHKAVAEAYLWGANPSPLKKHLAPEKREHGFDLLLLSDLIFNHQAHPALLHSMDMLLSKNGKGKASVPAPQSEQEERMKFVHDEANPLFPDQLPRGEFTKEGAQPDTPCVMVFFTSHRPHLAHKDMEFFSKAQEAGWEVERVGRWTRDPMFPSDAGSAVVRGTVHGFRLYRK